MPVTKSAIKKLVQDKKRESRNDALRRKVKDVVKKTKKKEEGLNGAFSVIDKAVKHNLMHKNKAARIKSALSKIVPSKAKATKTKAAPSKKSTTTRKTTSSKTKK